MTEGSPSRRPLKSREAAWAAATACWLVRIGIRPNAVSLASVLFAGLSAVSFWASSWITSIPPAWLFLAAALGIQLRLLCNLLDGMIAIEGGLQTRSGEIYNELPDRFADLLIIGGTGHAAGAVAWQAELAWITAGLAVTTAYVRALGVATGASQQFCGPMAKPHRMAALTVASVLNAGFWFAGIEAVPVLFWALVVVAGGCLVTIGRRCRRLLVELESK